MHQLDHFHIQHRPVGTTQLPKTSIPTIINEINLDKLFFLIPIPIRFHPHSLY